MYKVRSGSALENVVYKVLPDGNADVWIRQNQAVVQDEEFGESYEADEIYFRVSSNIVSREEIENDVSFWFSQLKDEAVILSADHLQVNVVMASKRQELSAICERTIYAGVDVELSSGVEHFSLTEKDQINLFGKQVQLSGGAKQLEYHQDGMPCKYYSADDMQVILEKALAYVSYQTTYCNSLFQWISSMEKASELDAVRYGDPIPKEYQSEVLKDYISKMESDQSE